MSRDELEQLELERAWRQILEIVGACPEAGRRYVLLDCMEERLRTEPALARLRQRLELHAAAELAWIREASRG
jgi:hypothetical protein